jgi:hypothetical protein
MRVYLGLGSRCEIIPYVVFELLYSIYEMCSCALMGLHHPSYYIQRGATIIIGYAPSQIPSWSRDQVDTEWYTSQTLSL